MDVEDYYNRLMARRHSIMADYVADKSGFAQHIASHNNLKDFDLMLQVINGPEREIFKLACREYQYSLEALIMGNYRHSFSSLRLCFELFTASTYFSAHQMKMQLWLQGHDDIRWAVLTDPDHGVYSNNFVTAFNPALIPYRAQYSALATTVYRECSEYVHGNPDTHDNATADVCYDPVRAAYFHERLATVKLCSLFQFITRYLVSLDLTSLKKIEPVITDEFGNLAEVQMIFGATAGE